MTTPRVVLGAPLVALLAKAAPSLPAPYLEHGHLAQEPADAYGKLLEGSEDAQFLIDRIRLLLRHRYGDGYAVVGAAPLLEEGALDDDGKVLTILLSWLGTPLQALDRRPLWAPLDTSSATEHATGTGDNPLHIDFANASMPPDYSALLCVRPDPRGSGESVVSSLRRAVARLSQDERDLLSHPAFDAGDLYGLSGVGEAYTPFPVLDRFVPEEGFVRFTAKMLATRDPSDPHTSAARALERELIADQQRFTLGRGDLLFVNQHLAAHGHEQPGGGQEDLPPDERPLMWQAFLRAPWDASRGSS
ncbi:TauD/TfdA family dioxygenase [Streptomyces longispororuber]|uniref:TauD/TfdA family dioxygenase n=1 Tax=Streptomyces longispororuber TaxID=68230 RepID=UPI0036FC8AF3